MGYLFAFAAVFCGAAKGFGGKKISAYTEKAAGAAYLNFIRMIMCIAIGFVLAIISDGVAVFSVSAELLFIAAFSGTMTAAMAISWLFAVRGGAYMLVDVFLTVGVTIPMILSSIFYGEKITLSGIIGLLILFCATAFLCSYSSSVKRKIRARDFIAISIAAITNGLIGFSQKMFNHSLDGTSALTFNFYVYVFSALVLGAFFWITRDKQEAVSKKMPPRVYAFVTMMAVCLFGHSFFNTIAASRLTALELYPLSQGSGLILSTLMASVFFGEKIKVRLVIGVSLAFIGVLIINLL